MYSIVWTRESLLRLIIRLGSGVLVLSSSAAIICMNSSSSYASEQTPQHKLCDAYGDFYDGANKNLASIVAEGTFDDSAPRESNRQMKLLNERIMQLILIQQMQAHGCDLPKMISSGSGYVIDAMECRFEIIGGNADAPECNKSNWKSMFGDLKHFQ